jgi:ABC-2 type transport system ATP-binding protein
MTTEPAVEAIGLTKTYPGGIQAVRGLDFTVAPGEVFGLLGPNGAGKSTTVGIFTTTVRATSGVARLAGFDVRKDPLLARSVSSVVFQEPVVDGSLTGRENLALHGRLWGVDQGQAKRLIGDLSDALGIEEQLDRPADTYSGGQRRRLEIARALVSTPRVLFLDEPTVGLDPRIRHELLDVIGGLRAKADTTIVLTTHYLDEAERLCDRVAIVHKGEIVALDSPRALLNGLGEQILEFQADEEPHAALAALKRERIAKSDAFVIGARVTVPLHGGSASDALAAIEQLAIRARDVSTRVPTLDDVYLQRTGADLPQAA